MTKMLEIKAVLKDIYARYDAYILPVLKFILAMFTFGTINSRIGYMSRLKNPFIVIILGLLCSFLPVNVMVVFAAFFMILHLVSLSLEAAAIGAVLLILMLVLYFAFDSKHGYALLLTPLAFAWSVPCVIPLIFGLLETPISAVAIGCGVVLAYFIGATAGSGTEILSGALSSMEQVEVFINGVLKNPEMIIALVAFVTVVMIVYIIRKLSVDYAWTIAIVTGSVVYILIMVVGTMALGVPDKLVSTILGSVLSLAAAMLVQFFVFSVDYRGSRQLQFEDDEYVYYVKAVPKMTSEFGGLLPAGDKKRAASQKSKSARKPARKKPAQKSARPEPARVREEEPEDEILSKYLNMEEDNSANVYEPLATSEKPEPAAAAEPEEFDYFDDPEDEAEDLYEPLQSPGNVK